ncbi:MAG: isochorismatase [Actinomycetota bacterium]
MRLHGPYQARPIRFLELWQPQDWRFKVYGIAYGAETPDPKLVAAIKRAAQETRPQPGVTDSRYGLGFISAHQGRTVSVGFVDWWENEDELHHKMFVAHDADLAQIRPAGEHELTGCSWDLALMAFERNAWVQHILQSPEPDVDACLRAHLNDDI